jgi:hypothetical protein
MPIPDRLTMKLVIGLGCMLLLALLVHDRNRWKAKTSHYAELLAAERGAHAASAANYRAAAELARQADKENAARAINQRSAHDLESRMPSACAGDPKPLQPIPAVAEQRRCPAYPLPPETLLKPPAKTDFLTPTG